MLSFCPSCLRSSLSRPLRQAKSTRRSSYIILSSDGVIQVFVQMAFWMHMKDRGHTFPIIGILIGRVRRIHDVIMAEYWAWW